jgi:uncharacterized membrane protein
MQALNEHTAKDGFRLRGTEVSRIDAFSDVVFGFALTLIVVSQQVPRTYAELHNLLLGFPAFFICFILLISLWWEHYRFFRRYGLQDPATILINAALLITVLFYVYPLKFLFTIATGHVAADVFTSQSQVRELMVVYGAGFAAIYLCLAALYWNAWRQRLHLRLSPLEITLTRIYIWDEVGMAGIGLLCCLIAGLLPVQFSGTAGYIFFTIFLWKTIHPKICARYIRKAHARCTPEDHLALPR